MAKNNNRNGSELTGSRKTTRKTSTSTRKSVPTASGVAAAASQPRARQTTERKSTRAASEGATPQRRAVTAEERYRMIEQAAYFAAERAGFRGDPHSYWVIAEREVDARLKKL